MGAVTIVVVFVVVDVVVDVVVVVMVDELAVTGERKFNHNHVID